MTVKVVVEATMDVVVEAVVKGRGGSSDGGGDDDNIGDGNDSGGVGGCYLVEVAMAVTKGSVSGGEWQWRWRWWSDGNCGGYVVVVVTSHIIMLKIIITKSFLWFKKLC